MVAIGEGVNADNIAGCIEVLKSPGGTAFSPSSASRPGNVEKSLEWLRKQIGSKREFAIGTRAARPRAANTHSAVGKHWRNHHV